MRVIIEGYNYLYADVRDVLDGLNPLENIQHEVCLNYVGYFYNQHIHDCVFILPKVLMDKDDMVFSHLKPRDIINFEKSEGLSKEERIFIYEFAVWIYRAIYVYNKQNPKNDIVYHRLIAQIGSGHRNLSNTFLDILISLVRFNKENQDFFMFILKNTHSGYNKINWTRTISYSSAVVQNDEPFYLNPINKRHQINFDEELLVIFFSILNYINDKYGFPFSISMGFQLIKGKQFEYYIKCFGKKRLKQIKYKYFSDKALRIWELCYVFFDKAHQISIATEQQEYLLVKNFNIVFEAIIDELIGDKDIPTGLKKQDDGKRVDHMYCWKGLTTHEEDKPIYYIGDSKYYKLGNKITKESVFKQYTYARNVIQWNLDLFMNNDEKNNHLRKTTPKYRDDVTEGYNIVPNFFISAKMDKDLSYRDKIYPTDRKEQTFISRQFENRLFDRDTLLIYHYDVNFLYVVSLYARQNEQQKAVWKEKVRNMFRDQIQKTLQEQYDFYAMTAHAGVNANEYIQAHFQLVLGKIYTPFPNQQYFSLALDKQDPEGNNDDLLSELRKHFYIEECGIGQDPTPILTEAARKTTTAVTSGWRNGVLMVMMEQYETKSSRFLPAGKLAIGIKYTKESMEIVEHLSSIGYVLFHKRKEGEHHLFAIDDTCVVMEVGELDSSIYKNVNTTNLYIVVNLKTESELDASQIHPTNKKFTSNTRYDAQYSVIEDLK